MIARYQDYGGGNISVLIYNYNRATVVETLTFILVALLLAIGSKKDIASLIGLMFTLLCLWFLLIPLVMCGFNMLLTTIAIVSISTTASLLILHGFTRKALSAILGCITGVTAAGFFAWVASLATPLDGMNMLDAERLVYYATDGGMKVSGLLICGAPISSLGAVMDVAMSISSSVHEVHKLNPELSSKKLFFSGMNHRQRCCGHYDEYFNIGFNWFLAEHVYSH